MAPEVVVTLKLFHLVTAIVGTPWAPATCDSLRAMLAALKSTARRFLRSGATMKKIECFVILAMTVMALLAVAPSGARNTGNAYCSNCSGAQISGTDK